ncbi:aspartate aminotransferase family protein [Halorubrum sp. Ea8]|uniref:aspartate aminotransferase family protein n=1 Tax=Halorubrum sp. Ea8 TaxID=1383841 RepID=UPI000B99C421|nr:aspartate aminotransferase family protein [Halorubrum sp. Ea8]OYR46361.1 aspartate aminotransferase family protein [Halorubrum sp. Ea8]
MVTSPPIDEIHFSMEPDVGTVPGPESKQLLKRQREIDSNAVAYPRRIPVALEEAKEATIRDVDGNTFLDFFAGIGVLNVGHSNPYVLEGVQDQLEKLTHTVDFPTTARIEFIERLNDIAPNGLGGNSKVIFGGPSGSDAIEGSIKLAKHNTGRHGLLAFEGSYHGTTAGALSLTAGKAYKTGYGPLLADAVHVPFPNPTESGPTGDVEPFCPAADCCQAGSCARALDAVQRKFESPYGGHESPAGIWVEPIQGEGGVVVPPEGFLNGLRDIADDNDALLIFDEIQTGFGRTGEWFAAEHWGVTPDAMTMAKGIGGSGLPIGAMMYHEQYDTWGAGGHVGTFRGNVPAFVGGTRAIEYIESHDLLDHATDVGEYIRSRFRELAEDVDEVVDVRGKGQFTGVEFEVDGEPSKSLVESIQRECYHRGVLVWYAGRHKSVLRLLPPLVLTQRQATVGMNIITESIRDVLADHES